MFRRHRRQRANERRVFGEEPTRPGQFYVSQAEWSVHPQNGLEAHVAEVVNPVSSGEDTELSKPLLFPLQTGLSRS